MLDTSRKKLCQTSAILTSLGPNLFVNNIVSEEEQFRVRAGTVLPAYSRTEFVSAQDFSLDDLQPNQHHFKVEVCDIQGRLFSSNIMVNTATWIKEITLATDHHCCNVELEAEKEGLVLQVKQPVLVGEPLLMWFGEKLRAILDIPFLTSCHIEENLTYKCHLCDRSFDEPNPLKLHIALKCNKLSINTLWQKLAVQYCNPSFLKSSILNDSASLPYLDINFQMSQISHKPHGDCIPTLMNPILHSTNLDSSVPRCSIPEFLNKEYSASLRKLMVVSSMTEEFSDAVRKQSRVESNALRKPSERLSAFHFVSDCSLNSFRKYSLDNIDLGCSSKDIGLPISDPLILENEASSSGKTNDGNYQCFICHKRYSRKYGLKIHFRTHTGYKPLQCKYCGRAFGDPSNLNKHVRLHLNSENARYKCKYCDKGMVRRRDLERHIKKKHFADSL